VNHESEEGQGGDLARRRSESRGHGLLEEVRHAVRVGLHLYFDVPQTVPGGNGHANGHGNSHAGNGHSVAKVPEGNGALSGRLTATQLSAIFASAKARGWSNKQVRDFSQEMFAKASTLPEQDRGLGGNPASARRLRLLKSTHPRNSDLDASAIEFAACITSHESRVEEFVFRGAVTLRRDVAV
jgi:polygalacturonase